MRSTLDRSAPGVAAWQPVLPHLAALAAGCIAIELARGIALPTDGALRGVRFRIGALVAALVSELALRAWLVGSE